jgi:GcrA cell cycle regulator
MDAWHCHIWRGDTLVEWESRVWDAADDARLTLLWAEGMSTVQIGLRIERTTSAVIGRARRLRLLPRPSPLPGGPKPRAVQAAPRARREPLAPRKTTLSPHPPAPAMSPTPETLPPAARTPNPPTPRPVAFSAPKTCQWIEPDCDGPPWLMCGVPTVEHGPWCAEHRRRCWASNPRALAA